MLPTRWLRKLQAAWHHSRRQPFRRQPQLEALEDRCLLSTYSVTNTNDAGAGSFRQAILDSNANPGPNIIDFNIPGTGAHVIAVGVTTGLPLPVITNPVAIDGYSQPGSSVNTLSVGDNAVLEIELDGSALEPGFNGLHIIAGNSVVRGLMIDNFAATTGATPVGGSGILMDFNGGNVIEGNFFGLNSSGGTYSNRFSDVAIGAGSGNNLIGGTTPDTKNVISGAPAGIDIAANSASGNLIQGNLVGTDPSGTSTVPNQDGLSDSGTGNTIGGLVSGARNVFSGNSRSGVSFGGATGEVLEGNYIGINAQGDATLTNASFGILAQGGGGGVTIGGTTPGAGNVIGGLSGLGIEIDDVGSSAGTNGYVVEGNFFGTDPTGTYNFGNGDGILLEGVRADLGVANTTVAGNVIDNESLNGVEIYGVGAHNNTVEGNLIGTDPTGTVAHGNGNGVQVAGGAFDNTVGGTTAAARNIISGNVEGVVIADSATTGNVIEGNYVGTDVTGTVALGNFDGIALSGTGNTIGGTALGAGNVLSGNVRDGVAMGYAFNDVVEGNLIGVNAQDNARLSNGSFGILAAECSGDTIGGTTRAAANVIGGLSGDGIEIDDSGAPDGTNDNVIEGNFFGTDPTGTYNFGNAYGILLEGNAVTQGVANNTVSGNVIDNESLAGVEIYGVAAQHNLVLGNFIGTDSTGTQAHGNGVGVEVAGGAHNNVIGTTTAGSGNVIAYNKGPGVVIGNSITDSGTVGNSVRGNSIHNNGGLGIDLGGDGVTPNHAQNPSSGPNNLQNYPVLLGAVALNNGQTLVLGIFHGTPNTTFLLDFYASSSANPSHFGEGQRYLCTVVVKTDKFGNALFFRLLPTATTAGEVVSATATDPYGDTSEFSNDVTVLPWLF